MKRTDVTEMIVLAKRKKKCTWDDCAKVLGSPRNGAQLRCWAR
jgi:cyanate lyase